MEELKEWLIDFRSHNLSMLEDKAELPRKTLDHFVNNRRTLNKNHLEKLLPVLKKYGYKKKP